MSSLPLLIMIRYFKITCYYLDEGKLDVFDRDDIFYLVDDFLKLNFQVKKK
jgi:hypothetical protein